MARGQSLRELVLAFAQDLIFRYRLDPPRGFEYVSPAATAITGYTPEEHYAEPDLWFRIVDPDDRPALERLLHAAEEPSRPLVFRWVRKDGAMAWTEQRAVVVHDEAGRPVAVEGVVHDITDRKRAEEDRLAREAAEAADRAKSEFLARISHELRTPLNSILGFAQLLQMSDLPPDHREDVEHIIAAGRHLLDLIGEVLDIARIEDGRAPLSLAPVRVREVLEEVSALVRPLAVQRHIALQAVLPAGCGYAVLADRRHLKQVLLNLLSNAVKYNREGGLVLVSCEETPGGRLRVRVQDTGPGLAPDKVARLFTPFERLGAERTGVQGTGLGLALSRRLAEAMGGKLDVHSQVGVGSTFWVELPLVTGQSGETATATPTAELEVFKRTRFVLYIEDELSHVKLVQRLLASRPEVRLLPAADGGVGLELARQHRPHLILLDLSLGEMPGEDVLLRLRQDPATAAIPVVVVSAHAGRERINWVLNAGARAVLTKPLDVRQVLDLVDEILLQREPCHARGVA
ncbi:MAG: ATP-binding protein [Armatimonadota bacterium]|nr:ATP-binding protein [Armatimonadota bacterium]MDR7549595.1 ATP-binding protein [Armatimonadota bacterium]